MRSWFIIDFVAVIPFELIFKSFSTFNKMLRIMRLTKLYKIIKMTRLVRMLKIVKERNKLVKYLHEILKIGVGFERLLFFILIFIIFSHIAACLWILVGNLNRDSDVDNWIFANNY